MPFRGVNQLVDDIGAWGAVAGAKLRQGEQLTITEVRELRLMVARLMQILHGDPTGQTATGVMPKLERPITEDGVDDDDDAGTDPGR